MQWLPNLTAINASCTRCMQWKRSIVQCPLGNGMESFKSNRDALVVLPPPLVLPSLGARESRDLCIQGVTLDLIGLIQKWKSCKKPTIGRKWQASIQVTLWCITYRDSMATPLWLFYMSLWLWVRLKCLFLLDVQCPCPRYKMLVRQWYGEAGAQNRGQ